MSAAVPFNNGSHTEFHLCYLLRLTRPLPIRGAWLAHIRFDYARSCPHSAMCCKWNHSLRVKTLICARYGCSDISRHALQEFNAKTTDRLFSWKANLPCALQVDVNDFRTPALPHVLLLQYVRPR